MDTTSSTTPTPATTTVQHITKASSDQLLNKFAELDSPDDKKSLRALKRQKRSAHSIPPVSRSENSELSERKSLLLLTTRRSSGAVVRAGRSYFKSRTFRKRSFFGTIEKTWQRTVDGASKVFMEKQYNRHKRLLSDTI